MEDAEEPAAVRPKVTLLNGDVHTLGKCTTVNDVKVQGSQLFPDALPPEVNVVQGDLVLTSYSAVPEVANVIFCQRGRSSKDLWVDAFFAYAESEDLSGATRCRQEVEKYEPDFMERTLYEMMVPKSYISIVRTLIALNADVNMVFDRHKCLCYNGCTCSVFWDDQWEDGITPLAMAAHEGRTDLVNLLLDSAAHVDAANDMGYTPLARCVSMGHRKIVNLLISAKASVNVRDKGGWTPFLYCARKGHSAILGDLLNVGTDVEQLITELKLGDVDIWGHMWPTRCLRGSAEYDDASSEGGYLHEDIERLTGWSPIMLSADAGHVDCVAQLIAARANVNHVGGYQVGALSLAAGRGHKDVVMALVDAGAALTVDDDVFQTVVARALALARDYSLHEHEADTCARVAECVKYLLSVGAPVGRTALFSASEGDNKDAVVALVEAKAALDAVNSDGDTVVACAAKRRSGDTEIVKYLLSVGAPIGKTAVMHAARRGAIALVRLFLSHDGCAVDKCLKETRTSLDEWTRNLMNATVRTDMESLLEDAQKK